MGFIDNLKSVFGWGVPSARPRRTKADPSTTYQPDDPMDAYRGLVDPYKKDRRDRYDVYDSMDRMPDVSSILDAYSEDATQMDRRTESTVWAEGTNSKVVKAITQMLKQIQTEDWIPGCTRDTGKYGDDFARVVGSKEFGVTSLDWLDPRDIERVENPDGVLLGFEEQRMMGDYKKKLKDNPQSLPSLKPWDVLHWRIYKKKRLPYERHKYIYGTSLLDGSERIAKQVKILDDLLMIVRLTKSLDRRVYYVDVGRSPVEEEIRILKRWRRALKRRTYVDPSSGKFSSRFNPFAWTEDEFWPIKPDSNSRVENIPGLGSVGEMVDIDHFRDKFFGSFRAPKAYFGYEGDIESKATLSSQSIRWARAVMQLQQSVITGLTRLAQIHLAYLDLDTDAEKFRIMMTPPSVIDHLDRLEAYQTIVDVAERMLGLGEQLELDKSQWGEYIMSDILWLSKGEAKKFIKGRDKAKTEEPEDEPADDDTDDKDEPKEGRNGRGRLVEIDNAIDKVVARRRRVVGALPSELPNSSDQN